MNLLSYFRPKLVSEDDHGTLQILSWLHIGCGVLGFLGSCLMLPMSVFDPEFKLEPGIRWMFLASALYFLSLFFSGLFIRARHFRQFSLIVAGITSLGFPMGTILGGYTLYILCSQIGQRVYRDK